ncbi:MAG TPA: DinB family protein [Longimicrobiales bacterium]|nr:DinB family protein [Longimicrobiales bacterium]
MSASTASTATFISRDALLDHWQGHRRLTRRVLEAFPEDQLFTFSLGGMRTFGEMALELLAMAAPMAQGLATGDWEAYEIGKVDSKGELLRLWDESTAEIDDFWPRIPAERFQESVTSFGQYTGPGHWQVLYVVDNEIHHRGQAYVYLRALGVEPPPFWER